MLYSNNDARGFERFFELFDEFLQRSNKTEGYEAKKFWETDTASASEDDEP